MDLLVALFLSTSFSFFFKDMVFYKETNFFWKEHYSFY